MQYILGPILLEQATKAGMLTLALYAGNADDVFGRSDWSLKGEHSRSSVRVAADAHDRNSDLSAQIISYRDLPAGWDGQGSVTPTADAIDDALAFIDLIPLGIEQPEPMVAADGEVGFYWKTRNSYIDVGFKGNETIAYYAKAGILKAEDIRRFRRLSLPKELLDIIALV